MVNPWAIDPYLSSGVALGLVLIVIYIIVTLKNRGEHSLQAALGLLLDRSLGTALGLLLAACGIAGGAKLCILSMLTEILVPILSSDERGYIFAGGLAIIWISVRAVYGVFFDSE